MSKSSPEFIEKALAQALSMVVPEAPDTELYVKQLRKGMEAEKDLAEYVFKSLSAKFGAEQVDKLMGTISLLVMGVPQETVALFVDVMEKGSEEYFTSLSDEQKADITAVLILTKLMCKESAMEDEEHLPCTCAKCMAKAPEA